MARTHVLHKDPVCTRENGTVPFGMVPFGTRLLCKRETVSNGFGSNYNGGGMCSQSQKYRFLRYLAHEIIKQTKESSFTFISVLFYLRSMWFCPFTLEPSGQNFCLQDEARGRLCPSRTIIPAL